MDLQDGQDGQDEKIAREQGLSPFLPLPFSFLSQRLCDSAYQATFDVIETDFI